MGMPFRETGNTGNGGSLCRMEVYREFKSMMFMFLICSDQFSHSVMSKSLRPHGLQHTRLPCPSPNPRGYSNSYPLSQWCHPTISSSVIPFSSHLQSFPASSLKEFPAVCCDPHSKGFDIVDKAKVDFFVTPLLFQWSNGYWQFDLWVLCLF